MDGLDMVSVGVIEVGMWVGYQVVWCAVFNGIEV
jgi:hypothetical protein